MIYEFGHAAITTRDLKVMREFYEKLGLTYAFTLKDEGGSDWIVYMRLGSFFLELIRSGEDAHKGRGYGLAHVCFLVDDMYKTLQDLKSKGVSTTEPAMGKDGNIQCWVKDPEGNDIELMQILPGSPQAKAVSREGMR
ncbi:MAG: VOC family protein [Candidatus Marsarchaeota archaeon]